MSNTEDLSHIIPLKNQLLADQKYADAVKLIVERLRTLPNHMNYRQDTELLLLVCNLIEHITLDFIAVDKESMAMDILNQVFCLTPTEQDVAKSSIKFLLCHNRIKKLNTTWVMIKDLMAYLKKKVR